MQDDNQKTVTKTRVMVVYGGRSSEHEVSCQSAASVIAHLDRDRFEILTVGIDKKGYWHFDENAMLESSASKALPIDVKATQVSMLPVPDNESIVESCGGPIDVVFPVLHGPLCEDGCIQGLFELADVAYVGSSVLGSAVSMDKDVAKRLVLAAGHNAPEYISFKAAQWTQNRKSIMEKILGTMGLPLFVKPANLGSSVGIQKAISRTQLDMAIDQALQYDHKILVEKAVQVREIELAVLEDDDPSKPPLVSIPGEVVPQDVFYSYKAKYLDENGARLDIPADLSAEQIDAAQKMAGEVFQILECEGMARVDLFLEKQTGRLLFNEINTIPGFTTISMYPKLFEASGVSYSELLTRLIDLAMARARRKRSLKREYDF